MRRLTTTLFATFLLVATAQASPVHVSATGTVAFNAISTPPLNAAAVGQQATVAFTVDSANFVDGIPGDLRSYVIDQPSFVLSFSGGASVGLLSPFPGGQTPYFTLVDGFPVSDGFFVSTSTVSPGGVPLSQTPLQFNLDLGYVGATLGSLNILDAIGVYGFGGLTRFGFTLWQAVPDNIRMEINFQQLSIDATVSTEPSNWSGVKALFR